MTKRKEGETGLTRRSFLSLTGEALVASGAVLGMGNAAQALAPSPTPAENKGPVTVEPFWGTHQGGIATPAQKHTYFASFDLATDNRDDVIGLLQEWTLAASRMTQGLTAKPIVQDPANPGPDGGEALGLPPARLTLTFGFGPGLFVSAGKDRFGLQAKRPEALVDLPRFNGDQLIDGRTDGDISVQACSDDPQVAFHAVRELARLSYGAAEFRWVQSGFVPGYGPGETPRNLMGFKDGTSNPSPQNPHDATQYIWVGKEGPTWMQGGSYLVVRRIRIALEHWDRMSVGFQEQVVGRHKYTGAPLGCPHEHDPVNLNATDKDGNTLIPDNSHVRLAVASTNDGARIFRRPYSYNDGVAFTAERWPPWRQGMEYDAGLFFVSYQRDPRTGFIKIFDNMSKFDMLNQFATHTGGGIFACPQGVVKGEYIGQKTVREGISVQLHPH